MQSNDPSEQGLLQRMIISVPFFILCPAPVVLEDQTI
jgi:hypothetical protein